MTTIRKRSTAAAVSVTSAQNSRPRTFQCDANHVAMKRDTFMIIIPWRNELGFDHLISEFLSYRKPSFEGVKQKKKHVL